jgi:hypothetical protein
LKGEPMTLKPGFDDEFQPKGRERSWLVRLIGYIMIVLATCGVAISIAAGPDKPKRRSRVALPAVRRPIQNPQVKPGPVQPQDPFVVVAAEEIDAKMVVAAPVGIDEAMVFDPETRGRQPAAGAAVPDRFLIPLPGNQPGRMPGNVVPPLSTAPAQPR